MFPSLLKEDYCYCVGEPYLNKSHIYEANKSILSLRCGLPWLVDVKAKVPFLHLCWKVIV